MAAELAYESPVPWEDSRPETVIVACVDGRWRPHMQEFAINHLKAGDHADFMMVPGGIEPLTLFDFVPKDFSFFRRRIEGLVEAHGTRRIIAIAHQDCAWYRSRKIGTITLDLGSRQILDLRRAAARLREMFPRVVVETYFAKHSSEKRERIIFETIS